MVRVLALKFIYDKKSTSPSPMGEDVSLTMALAIAEGHKSKTANLRALSKLTLPFWIVQTSNTTSILLSAFGNRTQSIETYENTRLSEIRRILGSEISTAEAIPDAVERITSLMNERKSETRILKHVEYPDILGPVSSYIVERDLNITPNRLDETIDSQDVLQISSEFQDLRDSQALKIQNIESLRELITEKLQGHLNVLENRISLEKQQWDRRISALDERIQQQVQALGSKTSDQIFDMKEKYKIHMRGVTAEFSRAITDIEEFFSDLIEQIRITRTAIHSKGEDVEGAIAKFNELVDYISETAPNYKEVLERIKSTSERVRSTYNESMTGLEEKSAEIKGAVSDQSAEYEKQKEDLMHERDIKIKELDELQENVGNHVTRLRRIVQERLTELQQKLLSITSLNLENDSIRSLAPLTRLDIDTFVAIYDNDSYIIFTPCFMPVERIVTSDRHRPLDNDFDLYISKTIGSLIEENRGFKERFDNCCLHGNMLTNSDGLTSIRSGLTKMQLTQLLEEGAKEQLEGLWSKYSGQCPKCGAMAGVGSKFCPGCGATLSH